MAATLVSRALLLYSFMLSFAMGVLHKNGLFKPRLGPGQSLRHAAAQSNPAEGKEAVENTQIAPFFPIYYNDVYEVILPPKHRFPMEKYAKVRQLVQDFVFNLKAEEHAKVRCDFRVSPLATINELATTHDRSYIHRFMNGSLTAQEERNVGFPWSPEGVERAQSSAGGTVAAACAAVEEWLQNDRKNAIAPWGAHIAGGTHHAFFDRGEGFSVFSDIAVAANVILQRFPKRIRKVLIVDLDVHQGNGNAVLFQDRPEVFTFSMHCSANYFSEKQQSDLDIEIPAGGTDETYLMSLHYWLGRLKREVESDLIFFQAGVDVLDSDRLGRLALTAAGVQRRNEMVYKFARELDVPLIITMGGGYPKGPDWTPILTAHANVYIQAHQFLAGEWERDCGSTPLSR